MDATNTSSWLQLTQQFGLPLVLFFGLVALLLAVALVLARWGKPRLDQIADAIVGVLNGQRDEQKRQGDCLQQITGELEVVREQLVALRADGVGHRTELGQVLGKLDLLLDRAARAT